MQDVKIALFTNPIFRTKCFTELLEYALPGYAESSMFDTMPARTLFLNKNLSVKFNETASNDVTMQMHIDFSFTGAGRSEKVMYEFIKLTSRFLKETNNSLAKQNIKSEYSIDTRAILENYLLFLNDGVKGLNVNASAYLPSDEYRRAVQLLSDVLRKLKNNGVLRDFLSQDEQSLIVRYISGADGAVNALYTVWKYNVIALYHRLAKLMANGDNNYKIVVSGDFDTSVRITINTTVSLLGQAFDRLIVMRTLQKVIDVMFCGVELEISTPRYPATNNTLEAIESSGSVMLMLGILPVTDKEENKAGDKSGSYTVVMPLADNTSEDVIRTLKSADYTILFEAPERVSSPQLPSYDIFGDMWDTVVDALTDYTTVTELPDVEGKNYRVFTGDLVPEGLFLDTAQYLLFELSDNLDLDTTNGLCNDLMTNGIGSSLYTYLLQNMPLEEIDSDDINLEKIFSGISEDNKNLKDLKVQDVFAREKLNISNISTMFLDGNFNTGRVIDEYGDWYIENSSSNRPVNTFSLRAITFSGDVREPLPLYDYNLAQDESGSSDISIVASEEQIDRPEEESTFYSELVYKALEYKGKLRDYQEAVNSHLENCKDLKSVIEQGVFSSNNMNSNGTTSSPLLASVTRLIDDFEPTIYNTLSDILKSGDDEVINNCMYNLILGDVSTDLYRRLFDSKLKESVRREDLRNVLAEELNFSDEELGDSDSNMVVTSTMTTKLTQALQQIGFMMRDCIRCSLIKNHSLLSNSKTIRTIGGIDYNGLDLPELVPNSKESFHSYLVSMLHVFGKGTC